MTGLAYGSPLVPECRTQKISGFNREYLAVQAEREVWQCCLSCCTADGLSNHCVVPSEVSCDVSHHPPISALTCAQKSCVSQPRQWLVSSGLAEQFSALWTRATICKNQMCPRQCWGKLCWSMNYFPLGPNLLQLIFSQMSMKDKDKLGK